MTRDLAPAVVTLLTDFGRRDPFVGVCHAVILRGAPDARIVDLTHDVPPQDVRAGAGLLARAVVHTPVAVHCAVVDPGVGTARAALALQVERGDRLVGPDNGLLAPAADALGGVIAAVHVTVRPEARVSATFHGRDVFAPAAATLASGADLAEVGTPVTGFVELPPPGLVVEPGSLVSDVEWIDVFGNVALGAGSADLERAGLGAVGASIVVSPLRAAASAERVEVRRVRTFADLAPGEPGLLIDSDGLVSLVAGGASAAAVHGLRLHDRVLLARTG